MAMFLIRRLDCYFWPLHKAWVDRYAGQTVINAVYSPFSTSLKWSHEKVNDDTHAFSVVVGVARTSPKTVLNFLGTLTQDYSSVSSHEPFPVDSYNHKAVEFLN